MGLHAAIFNHKYSLLQAFGLHIHLDERDFAKYPLTPAFLLIKEALVLAD